MRERVHALTLGLALAIAATLGVVAGGVRGQDGLPSLVGRSLIYPVQQVGLHMSHSHPAHRDLPCTRCHENAATSRRSADLLVPAERSCLPCHARDTRAPEGTTPPQARCATCHDQRNGTVVPPSFPPPRITFSHAAHVTRGMACVACHARVQDVTVATTADLPGMRDCLRCHGGAQPTAPTACRTCHLTEPDGVMRTRFPEGELTPPSWLLGMQHDADWIVRHRWVGADQGAACASCHRERECEDCHDGRVRSRRVHPSDWLSVHPPAARRDSPRCSSCHEPQRFCAECHARLGLSTTSAPVVRNGARYHPPAAVWDRGHALEARRSMSSCITCHAERDCTACHGAAGIGGGVSPHPPGFANGCAALLHANPRACTTCHGDPGALAARCR